MGAELYDVVAVSIATGKVEELVAQGKTFRNAEAVENMAVMRRGCDAHFFATVTAGASVQAAVDEVLGAGTYAKLAAETYDRLNASAAATATRQ